MRAVKIRDTSMSPGFLVTPTSHPGLSGPSRTSHTPATQGVTPAAVGGSRDSAGRSVPALNWFCSILNAFPAPVMLKSLCDQEEGSTGDKVQ